MKWITLILMSLAIALTSCTTPYPGLEPLEFDELSYPFAVKKAELSDNITMAYVDEGAGDQTIIFVHGLGSYLPAWQKNIADLKSDYRCIAVDLPGYGKSSKGVYPITLEFYADKLIELMDTLNLDKATFTGHSMGGQISIIAALKYPERVDKLMLVAPAGIEKFSPGEGKWFKDVMTVDAVRLTPVQQIRANVVGNFYDMPADAEFMITDRIALRTADGFEEYCYTIVQCVSGMLDQPTTHLLDKIQQPTLIIFGENDNLIPNRFLHPGHTEEIGRMGADKIPNSTLVIVSDCGHFAQFEEPEVVNKTMRDFLQ